MSNGEVTSKLLPDAEDLPCWWTCTNEVHHGATDRIGHSMLDAFRESPRDYRVKYSGPRSREPKGDALRLGSAAHDLAADPVAFLRDWFVLPEDVNLRTKAGRSVRDAAITNRGDCYLTAGEFSDVRRWIEALMRGRATGPLLRSPGVRERSLFWQDEETGLICKCRPDLWLEEARIVVDIKTSRNARPDWFRKEIEDRGYHRGAAWYLDGLAQVAGPEPIDYMFAVVGKDRLETAAYTLRAEDLAKARDQNRRALVALAACYESGDWTAQFERQVTELSLAGHAFAVDDYELL